MARFSERLSADAYLRDSVEAYLQAAAEQRAKIELGIAEAERRHEAALEALDLLDGRLRQTMPTGPVPIGVDANGKGPQVSGGNA